MAEATMTKNEREWTITVEDPQKTTTWKGPRNLPKPDARKKKRREAKRKRKINRGAYSGR